MEGRHIHPFFSFLCLIFLLHASLKKSRKRSCWKRCEIKTKRGVFVPSIWFPTVHTWRFRLSSLPAAVRLYNACSQKSSSSAITGGDKAEWLHCLYRQSWTTLHVSATLIWTFGFDFIYACNLHHVLSFIFWLSKWVMACGCKFLFFLCLIILFFQTAYICC